MAVLNWSPFRRIIEIIIGGYMESGIIQWALFGCAIPDQTAKPWQILLADQPGNVINPAQGFLQAYNPVSGEVEGGGIIYYVLDPETESYRSSLPVFAGTTDSLAFGCTGPRLVNTLPLADCLGNIQTYYLPGMCSRNLLAKKYAMSRSPGSIFSGVMRRYVQAMYGAQRFDMSVSADKVYPHIKIPVDVPQWAYDADPELTGEIEISQAYPNYIFIRRTAEYRYFFVIYDAGNLYVSNMSLSTQGEAWRQKLQDEHAIMDLESRQILESYILAEAKPGFGVIATVPVSGSTPVGSPIGYTWSSNEDGSKHCIVLHDEDVALRMYRAREYELTVNMTSSDDGLTYAISASVAVIDEPKVWNPRDYKIWAHDYQFGGNFWLSGSWAKILQSSTPTDASVPIYAYYYNLPSVSAAVKKVIKITDSVVSLPASLSGTVGAANCDSFGFASYRVDSGNGYTHYTSASAGGEGTRGLGDLSGPVSRVKTVVNAGVWTAGSSPEDSAAPVAGMNADRFTAGWPDRCKTPNCDGDSVSLLDGGEGDVTYTNAYQGYLVVDRPIYNASIESDLYDWTTCWAYVPWNCAHGLTTGMSHALNHGDATMLENSPCTPIATGVYLNEYLDGAFVRTSTIRVPNRVYVSTEIAGPPAQAINAAVTVSPYVESDNVISFVINDDGVDIPVEGDTAWLYDIINPSELFQTGQVRAVGYTGLMGGYKVSFFGSEWEHVAHQFGPDGIGGIGWG